MPTMDPLYFGSAERPLFGWLHRPVDRAPRRTGVLVCPPFGHEYALAHRALHQLGRRLAEAGFAALRFDWFGTGDSSGELEQADFVLWRQDLAAASAELRRRIACDDIALVGLRLGASLAALASGGRDTAALALWDPIVRGGDYVRELGAGDDGELRDASGFPVSERLSADLAAIDLAAAPLEPGLPVLLLQTGAGERADALLEGWRRRGHPVERRDLQGPPVWEEGDPTTPRVLVPQDALHHLVSWLEGVT